MAILAVTVLMVLAALEEDARATPGAAASPAQAAQALSATADAGRRPSELDELAGCRPGSCARQPTARGSPRRRTTTPLGRLERARGGRQAARPLVLAQVRSPLSGSSSRQPSVATLVGERVNGAIILTIIASSVGLGVFNEYGSEQTLAALRKRTGRRAAVLRDGEPVELAASLLVPGDVCLLQAGDVVPADMRLLEVGRADGRRGDAHG